MKALGRHAPRRWKAALAVVAAAVVAAWALQSLTDERGYVVYALFDDAAGIRKNSEVQIGGVPIGTVESLVVTAKDDARVRLRVERSAAPIGRNARAYVRPANLFGEKYVELEPGDVSRPAAEGAEIPRHRTGAPVELDDLLAVLDTSTRARLSILIHESGEALAGRGGDFNAMLARLPPALDQATRLVGDLASDNKALGSLIEESDRVLVAVAQERAALGRLVGSAEGALTSFARRHRELGRAVEATPPLLVELRSTLARLDNLSRPLGPAATAMRSTAQPLAATLRELPSFTRIARPTFRAARDVAPQLVRLASDATPVLNRLRPTARELTAFARSLDPVSRLLEGSIDDVLGILEGWARATQARDGLGHLFRGQLVITEQVITSYLRQLEPRSRRAAKSPRAGRAPERPRPDTAPKAPEPPRATRPRDEESRPRLPDAVKPVIPDVDGVPEVVPPNPGAPPAAPGDDHVEELLDYLLAP